MNRWKMPDNRDNAALWFLGQSGFYFAACGKTVVIDPYLSDSVGEATPEFTRAYPPPVAPGQIQADIFIVTHNHLDHLDPETIKAYPYKEQTRFVAPRHAAKRLKRLGVPQQNITVLDHGDHVTIDTVKIEGVFALGTGKDVLDTTGYRIVFPNKKSVYHTSDTTDCTLLHQACPRADVFLPVINGKFGNLNAEQAVELAKQVKPRVIIPHHFDVMALNAENPKVFAYFCEQAGLKEKCKILKPLKRFEW